ncbi:OmpA family protein [Myxococcota bacterium]|nr:OmpA family protein [Myxococcota bacterium]
MLLTLSLLSLSAYAQDDQVVVSGGEMPDINAQLFRPSIDSTTMFWTDDTVVLDPNTITARALFNYAHEPLIYYPTDGEQVDLIKNLLTADVMIGFTRGRARFGLDIPVFLRSTGTAGGETGIGDLGIDAKFNLLNRLDAPVGLSVYGRAGLPTATMDSALSYGGLSGELGLIVDKPVNEKLLLAANVGTRIQPKVVLENATWNDQLYLRLGGSYALSESFGTSVDIAGSFTYANLTNPAAAPIEGILGAWTRPGAGDLVVRGGVGTALTGGIGAPTARVLFALGYEPTRAKKPVEPVILDSDNDGLLDNVDACPDKPEDMDTYKDDDGCPEPTVVTFRFVDQDGQPANGLGFTVADLQGASSMELPPGEHPMTITGEGFAPTAGVAKVVEGPPIEIVQTVPYLTGTIIVEAVDAKGKRIPDASWLLNDKPKGKMPDGKVETLVRVGQVKVGAEAEGYLRGSKTVELKSGDTVTIVLDLKPSKTKVQAANIDLGGSVFFETNKDVIKPESYKLLDDVASIMKEHPELKLVRIEGHTDSRGDDAFNMDLSQRRTEAVRNYLINKGVEANRLEAKGYGETKPLVQGNNEAAWAKNRRVDFFIVERTDMAVDGQPKPVEGAPKPQ